VASRFYPAVLERSRKTYAVWLPDFPDCVAAGTTQEQAIEKMHRQVAQSVQTLAEQDKPMPTPTAMDKIEKPDGFIAFVMVELEPPNPSERVNVYLPKRLIERADARATELGMSRSSFFGYALNIALATPLGGGITVPHAPATAKGRSK
jgi:predicted RNase H-like HicB family nuclease